MFLFLWLGRALGLKKKKKFIVPPMTLRGFQTQTVKRSKAVERRENENSQNRDKNYYEKDQKMIRKCPIFIFETLSNKTRAFKTASTQA